MDTNSFHLNTAEDYIFLGMSLLCVSGAAMASGLTLSLMSFDDIKLQIKAECGTDAERRAAISILPLISNRHRLLCTLLIFNSVVNEALPIFLDVLVPSSVAIVLSVTLVLLFGEVLPSSVFTGPNQLTIASKLSPIVHLLMFILAPLAIPMGMGLDWLLGTDDETMSREELSILMHLTRQSTFEKYNRESGAGGASNGDQSVLTNSEVNTITGVLGLAKKCVQDLMIPIEKVSMLAEHQILDLPTLSKIEREAYSRIPVFSKERYNIVGYVLTKKLILVNPLENTPLSSRFGMAKPLIVAASMGLHEVLDVFQSQEQRGLGRTDLAIVSERPEQLRDALSKNMLPTADCRAVGVVTLGNIFDEILQQKALSETRALNDNPHTNTDATASVLRHLIESKQTNKHKYHDLPYLRSKSYGFKEASSPSALALPVAKSPQRSNPLSLFSTSAVFSSISNGKSLQSNRATASSGNSNSNSEEVEELSNRRFSRHKSTPLHMGSLDLEEPFSLSSKKSLLAPSSSSSSSSSANSTTATTSTSATNMNANTSGYKILSYSDLKQ